MSILLEAQTSDNFFFSTYFISWTKENNWSVY